MEASAAAGPGPAQGQAAGQGEGEGATDAQQGGLDVSAITQTLESLRGGQEDMRAFLQSQPWQQQEAEPGAEELPALDLSALDPDNPAFDANQVAQNLTGYIEQQAQQRADALVRDHIEPLKQQQDFFKRSQEARDLVEEFPEMREEEVARSVLGITEQIAKTENAPQLANAMWLARLVYLAGRATDAANAEGDEDPRAAHLEGGGGAGPGGGQQAGMTAADIVGARRGASALPFT